MNNLFRSATLKLTLWYMAILTLICLTFSFAIYQFATNELRHSLGSQSRRLMRQYPGFNFDSAFRVRQDYQQGSNRILLNLVYFDAAVLLLAGFLSYALARRTLEPIAAAHEQQKRFTADVSHELRTPLTALKMSSEVALLDNSQGKVQLRKTIESNLEEADKLESLINNLLRLTKLEVDELQGSFSNVSVEDLCETAIDSVAPAGKSHKIPIRQSVQPGMQVHGDRDSLLQLLIILLDNAIKHSKPNDPVVLSATAEANKVVLSVTDTGAGIEPAHLPHVFDRFYRADSARTGSQSGNGFGLGLSIAKMIADVHETSIELTSAPGVGTTARVALERAEPPTTENK